MIRLVTLLLAAGLLTVPAGAAGALEGNAADGEKVFKKCKACHKVGEDAKNAVGPPLNDIIGAKAGAQDYKYSASMKEKAEAGLVWNEEMLDQYLANPKDVVPRGKMAFPGLRKEQDRADVIAYLKQFSKPKEGEEPKPAGEKKGQ